MNDELRLVIQAFDGAVVDGHPEVIEDVGFVPAEYPGKVAHRRQPGVRCPPEPAREIALRPPSALIAPEMREGFLQEIRSIDLEIETLEFAQAPVLGLGEIPRILQPDEARFVHQDFVRRAFLMDLVAADLVDGLHEMTDDVELVEHQHGLAGSVLDDVDIRLPHVAADAFEGRRFLRAEEVEERIEGVHGAAFPLHTNRVRARS